MKLEKKQITMFIGIIFIALIVVVIAVVISNAIERKKDSEMTLAKQQLVNLGEDKEKVWKMSDDEVNEKIEEVLEANTTPGYTFDKKKNEYDKTDETYNQILEYIKNDDYSSITSLVDTIKNSYNFTTRRNLEIINAYEDASKLGNIKNFSAADYESFLADSHSEIIFLRIVTTMESGKILRYYLDYSGVVPYFDTMSKLTLDKIYSDTDSIEQDSNYIKMKNILESTNWSEIYRYTLAGDVFGEYAGQATCYVLSSNHTNLNVLGCYSTDDKLLNVTDYNEFLQYRD